MVLETAMLHTHYILPRLYWGKYLFQKLLLCVAVTDGVHQPKGDCRGHLTVGVISDCWHVQMAAKAQRASVEPAEVVRYEEYDSRHGARYVDADAADMDEDW